MGGARGPAAAMTALLATLLAAGAARAQATYGSATIGGRSALMGGTGIALGRDGASPFLNPATVVHIDDSGIAFSANFYSYQTTRLTDFHQPGPASAAQYGALSLPNTSLDAWRVDALPSTFCLFLDVGGSGGNTRDTEREPRGRRKGRKKLAACIVTPERQALNATASGYAGDSAGQHATQALSINQWWTRFYVGPSYSVHVTDAVALGGSLQTVGTIANSTWGVDTLVSNASGQGSASSYDTGANAYSLDLAAVLGLVWHIDDSQILGLSVMTPSVHLAGQYQGTSSVQTQDGASTATQTTSNGSYRAPVPLRIGAGLGADLGRARVEVDATAYIPVTDLAHAGVQTSETNLVGSSATSTSFSRTLTVAGRPIVDAAVGLEWFTSPSLSLLGGLATDFSAMAPLSQSPPIGTLAETRVQRATASFGVGSYGDGSELLFGTQLACGWGKSIAVDPYVSPAQLTLVDSRTYGAMLIIAGSVSLSAFKRTLQDLRTVVKIPGVK
jgi:hypothetical protein